MTPYHSVYGDELQTPDDPLSGCDSTYHVLLGPDGFECALTEPEDRNWDRDGAKVVAELNRLHAENVALRSHNNSLADMAAACKGEEAGLVEMLGTAEKERNELRVEAARLRAALQLAVNSITAAIEKDAASAPLSADAHLDEAVRAAELVGVKFTGGKDGDVAELRGEAAHVLDVVLRENTRLQAALASFVTACEKMYANPGEEDLWFDGPYRDAKAVLEGQP